eukprot:TRINITY_DN12235_c0_g1_i1.p1 TRINITY_DN12235_c0_g1~~TRINITY_DN12235_c0_g1_i1.p1  ORF type:complete len:148 (-),score=30.06 TRINITY_DN12235_c0_g1_i1:50-493(-)
MSTSQRLQKELMTMMTSGDNTVSAFPEGGNLFHWRGTVTGTTDTPYEGLTFNLDIVFPTDFPYSAPTITFKTPCFHPNVDNEGNICLDILKNQWSSVYSVYSVLISLQSLLGEPNNNDPLNPNAAELWEDEETFTNIVRQKFEEYFC